MLGWLLFPLQWMYRYSSDWWRASFCPDHFSYTNLIGQTFLFENTCDWELFPHMEPKLFSWNFQSFILALSYKNKQSPIFLPSNSSSVLPPRCHLGYLVWFGVPAAISSTTGRLTNWVRSWNCFEPNSETKLAPNQENHRECHSLYPLLQPIISNRGLSPVHGSGPYDKPRLNFISLWILE